MNTIVILTGPYGSNFKKFIKLLTKSNEVCKLNDLDGENTLWSDPTKIRTFDWSKYRYYVTSISCPTPDDEIPKYFKFINEFQKLDFRIVVAITSGKKDVLERRQKKAFFRPTTDEFRAEIVKLADYGPIYINEELLDLYEDDYTQFLQNYFKIPLIFVKPPEPIVPTIIH